MLGWLLNLSVKCEVLALNKICNIWDNEDYWLDRLDIWEALKICIFFNRFLKRSTFQQNLPQEYDVQVKSNEIFAWHYQLKIQNILLVYENSFGNIKSRRFGTKIGIIWRTPRDKFSNKARLVFQKSKKILLSFKFRMTSLAAILIRMQKFCICLKSVSWWRFG